MHTNKAKNLTIVDIAKLSGVGKSTVSRVINNESGVNAITREKILRVIAEQNFTPSKFARVLRGIKHRVVGIIVTRLDSPAENQAVRSMLSIFDEHDVDSLILESQFDNNKIKEHIMMLENRQIDNLILFAFTGLDVTLLSKWSNRIAVVARSFSNTLSICYDDAGAVNILLNEIHHNMKKNKISFIGVEKSDQTTGRLRYQSYLDFCHLNEMTADAYLGKLNSQTGYQYAKEAIRHQCDAILCATDSIALGVNKYLLESRTEEILVASVGSSDILQFLFPKTISVNLGFHEAGEIAAKELLELTKRSKPKTILVPCHILK